MKTIVLEAKFSSAHFYHQPKWSKEKNEEEFGRCFTDYGHGHNYLLLAEWADVSENEIPNLRKKLDLVVGRLDHEHLNFVIPEFKDKIPTTEVMLRYFEKKLNEVISKKLVQLRLFETADIGAQLR